MKDYVWERESSQIDNSIDNSIKNNETIIYWQTSAEGKIILSGQIIMKEPLKNNLVITCEKKSDLKKLEVSKDIYVKLQNRNTVFKSKLVNISKEVVEIEMPSSVKTIELRKDQRYEPQEESFALIEKCDTGHLGKMQFSFSVINESKNGYGLAISVSKKNLFEIGEKLKIIKYKGNFLSNPIMCKIIHMTKNDSDKLNLKNMYRFGLQKI